MQKGFLSRWIFWMSYEVWKNLKDPLGVSVECCDESALVKQVDSAIDEIPYPCWSPSYLLKDSFDHLVYLILDVLCQRICRLFDKSRCLSSEVLPSRYWVLHLSAASCDLFHSFISQSRFCSHVVCCCSTQKRNCLQVFSGMFEASLIVDWLLL